jgi:hypothetical protein
MKNSSSTIWTTLAFVGFGSLGIPMLADYCFARHRITERGIDYGSMFAVRRFMAWSEFKCVSFAPSMGWYLLESESGAKARISILLTGLKEFANQVLDHVPREKIEREACVELMLTASGASGKGSHSPTTLRPWKAASAILSRSVRSDSDSDERESTRWSDERRWCFPFPEDWDDRLKSSLVAVY